MQNLNVFNTKTSEELNPITQTIAHKKTSSRYKFQDSSKLLSFITDMGFNHVETSYANPRNKDYLGFQKHIMIFERDDLTIDSDNKLRLLVTNNHLANQSLIINLGIYRAICANGLVVGDELMEYRIRHKGSLFYDKVKTAVIDIVANAPKYAEMVRKMQNTTIDVFSEIELGKTIAAKRLEKVNNVVAINAYTAVNSRRSKDNGDDLWTVFNRIQENAVKGGISYDFLSVDKDSNWITKTRKTSKLRSIDGAMDINKFAWNEAVKLVA